MLNIKGFEAYLGTLLAVKRYDLVGPTSCSLKDLDGITITLGSSYPLFGFFRDGQTATPSDSAVCSTVHGWERRFLGGTVRRHHDI